MLPRSFIGVNDPDGIVVTFLLRKFNDPEDTVVTSLVDGVSLTPRT